MVEKVSTIGITAGSIIAAIIIAHMGRKMAASPRRTVAP